MRRVSNRLPNMADLLTDPSRLSPNESLLVECWTCSKTKKVSWGDLHFLGKSFSLTDTVKKIGWRVGVDFTRGRFLAFCSGNCEARARTRQGFFRSRRPE